MANTFTQYYIQFVFAVQNRISVIEPNQAILDLMRLVKGESSEWINKGKYVRGRFSWQEGCGGFTYGRSQIDSVYKYIMNQKEHHKKMNFIDEYVALLDKFEISYDRKYIFKEVV